MEKEKLVITKDNAHDYLGWFDSVDELIEKGKIDNTFGRGLTYTDNDEIEWHSRPHLNKDGKLTVRVLITTWAGAVANASHYYAQLMVTPHWTNEDETVISYNPRAPKLPEINMSLGYPLSAEELKDKDTDDPYSDWYGYEVGDFSGRFPSREKCMEVVNAVFNFLFDSEKCELFIDE